METTDWQTNLHTDVSKRISHIVLEGWLDLGLPQGVPKGSKSLETFLATIENGPKHTRPNQNQMQNPQSAILFTTKGCPDPSRPSVLLDNAGPSLEIYELSKK